MNLYKYIKENISENVISIEDVAWLYFCVIQYNGKIDLNGWKNDNRMNGRNFNAFFELFKDLEYCTFDGKYVIFDIEKSNKLIYKYFGSKTFAGAIERTYEYAEYYEKRNEYPIHRIPIEYYLKHLKPSLDKAFDRLRDIETDWYNHWSQRTAAKIAKFRYLKEANLYNMWNYYYPERIPEKLTIYRGLKSQYNKDMFSRYTEENPYYTSWTVDLAQAERFSKYHFTSFSFEKPNESKIQTIIKKEVDLNDITFFYDGDEGEVIMKEPVTDVDIIKSDIKENILVPRNLEGRMEKLRQMNIQLLSQEVIEGDLEIDETFEGIPLELIKVKEIKGDVWLTINKGYIPSWLKDVKIFGNFFCSHNNLTSLEGCPKYIGGNLYCVYNNIKLKLPEDVELKGKFINE